MPLSLSRLFFVGAACILSTGCMISGPIGLVGGTLIRAYMAPEDEAKVCGAQDGTLTVNQLLANARTLEPATAAEQSAEPAIDEPSIEAQDKPDARTSPLELNLDDQTTDLIKQIKSAFGDLSTYNSRLIQIGSGGNAADKRRLYALHGKVWELTSALGPACDCKAVSYDPTLPVGTLRLNFEKVS